jgi:hypothetical protein
MTRRSKISLAAAVFFLLVNLLGMVIAGVDGELGHTLIHAVLLLLSALVVRRLTLQRVAAY